MLEGVRRKVLGMIVAGLLACFLTYSIAIILNTIPGGILTMLGVVSLSGFSGGFVSRDKRAGCVSGLLAGVLAPLTYIQVTTSALHVLTFRFVLFGSVAGAMGTIGAWVEKRMGERRRKGRRSIDQGFSDK